MKREINEKDKAIAEIIGAKIKECRKEKGVTQKVVARVIDGFEREGGGDNTSISKYENAARVPSLETLITLADYFGCSVDYLLGRTECRKIEISEISEHIPLSEKMIIALRDLKKGCNDDKEDGLNDGWDIMTALVADIALSCIILDEKNGGDNERLISCALGVQRAHKLLGRYSDYRRQPAKIKNMLLQAQYEREACEKRIGDLLSESICKRIEKMAKREVEHNGEEGTETVSV